MKQTIRLGALSALNIGFVFLFQWYVLIKLGPGLETDSLFAGMGIPQLVLAVISGSLIHVLVPILAGESEDRLRHDAWGLLILVGSLFGAIAIVLLLTSAWWVPLTVPGFSQNAQALTIDLTRIQLIGMIFTAVNGVQWAAYHARQQFFWVEFSQILANTFAFLLLIWALPRYGIVAAAWLTTLRFVFQTLLLAPGMGRFVRPDFKSMSILQAWQRVKPLLWGTAYYKTDPLVDRFLLSNANSGNLSLFYLAQQIYGAISQVLGKAIATPLVPLLSKLHKSQDYLQFRSTYRQKLWQLSIICVTGLVVLVLLGQQILEILIGYGNVSVSNANDLWLMLIWLAGMFVGGALGQICASAFYACGDTVTPTRMSMFTYTIYVPSKVIAFYFWGILGLAVATSIYYILNLTCLVYLLERKKFV